MRRTRVFTEVFAVSASAPGDAPQSQDEILGALADYSERFRRASQLATFTRANGQTERLWSEPWRVEPAGARVLVTPPPWSFS